MLCHGLNLQNDLTFLRVRSKKHEIMIAPDKEYLLIVIQNPAAEDSAK
jgi:dynein light chain roadblock-type